MALPSPRAEAIATLKQQVEARLNQTHEDRISQLASRLQASLSNPFDRAACAEACHQPVSARAAALADPINQVRLSEVFDELLASDQANRMQQLNQEVTFRERELQRTREALERAQLEASWSKQKHETTEAQLSKVSNGAALLETELRRLQQENQQLAQQVQSLTNGKAAAERAATLGEARAATAEAALSSRTQELEQLQAHYKRLLSEQQAELDRLRQQVQAQAVELSRTQSEAVNREQCLIKELQTANNSLVDVKTAHAAEKSASELLQARVVELSAELESARKGKQQLQGQLQQAEGLLSDSEAERRSIRAKYMNLGDKLEGMLADEAKQQKTAAADIAALQNQLSDSQQAARSAQQQSEHTAAQLVEAQQVLVDADKLHAKAVRKLDRRFQQLSEEYDLARQELLIKSAEIMDLQGQVKEVDVQHQAQLAAAQDQADHLQDQIAQLQQQLLQAAEHEQQVQQEAVAAAEERLDLELRQQQLKYERQIQELELHSRYLTALDALSSPHSLTARQLLDQAAVSAGGGDTGLGLDSDGGASLDLPGTRSRFGAFDARLRRTLADHAGRAEAIEAMEGKLLSIKKELSADYKRRLDSLEAEWKCRSAARLAELEGTHALKLQQVDLTARLDKERLEARLADLTATKQSLEEQLTSSKQELSQLSKEHGQARLQAQEASVGCQLLQTQLDDAKNQLKQLQGVVDRYSGGSKGDREVIADLMSRLEARTAERNDSMQAAAAAHARLKVLESEKMPLQQRQMQQAVDEAENARSAAETKLRAAVAEAADAAAAAESAQSASARQLKRLQEEKQKLEESLEEVTAACDALEKQLNSSQAESRSLNTRLKETSQALLLLQEDYSAQESMLARLREERQQLILANTELESTQSRLSTQVTMGSEEQRRLSLMVQGLELSKAAVQRRLSVVEAEKQSAVRTTEIRSGSPVQMRASILGNTAASPDMRASIASPTTSGPAYEAGPSFSSPLRQSMTPLRGGDRSGGGASPVDGGRGSFAFQLRSSMRMPDSVELGGLAASQGNYCNMQDLEALLVQFDEERRAMLQRYDAVEAENSNLRQQLAASTVRASELSMNNEQLLSSLERHKGALAVESKAAQELADKVLTDVQRSSNDMAQLNSWLQSELDTARRGHKEALEANSAAEKKLIMLEAKASELQRAAAAAAREAEERYATQLSKLEVSSSVQISSMRSKLAVMKDDVKMQMAALAKEEAQRIAELGARHAKELQEHKDAAVEAAVTAAAEQEKQVSQLQQLLKDQDAAAAAKYADLQQQIAVLQERMTALVRQLLMVLQLPQQQQQQFTGQQPMQQQPGMHGVGGLIPQHVQTGQMMRPNSQQQMFANRSSSPQQMSPPQQQQQMLPMQQTPVTQQQQGLHMQQQQQYPGSPSRRPNMAGGGSPSRFSTSPGATPVQPPSGQYIQQQQLQQQLHHGLQQQYTPQQQQYAQQQQQYPPQQQQYAQQQQQPQGYLQGYQQGHNGASYTNGVYIDQLQFQQPPAVAGLGPLPPEVLELSLALSDSVVTDMNTEPTAESAAGALQVFVQGLCQHLAQLSQQVADAQQDNDQLVMDASALASDLQMCATNLQSLVATVAFTVTVSEEVQQGLNAKDTAVFDEQLAALHEAIKAHTESEKQQMAASMRAGPIADLTQQLEVAHAALAEATGTIKQMKTERQEEINRFELGINRARSDAADGAETARRESLAGLKSELQQMKAQLSQLQDAHSSELTSVQEASARQLAAHVKSADEIIKELESTANNLQTQLAAEVERADAYSKELKRVQVDKERQSQLDARKDRRATGEIEGLRERLRAMENRDKEKEDEMKQLKRNLRQKELSLLSSGATSVADR